MDAGGSRSLESSGGRARSLRSELEGLRVLLPVLFQLAHVRFHGTIICLVVITLRMASSTHWTLLFLVPFVCMNMPSMRTGSFHCVALPGFSLAVLLVVLLVSLCVIEYVVYHRACLRPGVLLCVCVFPWLRVCVVRACADAPFTFAPAMEIPSWHLSTLQSLLTVRSAG